MFKSKKKRREPTKEEEGDNQVDNSCVSEPETSKLKSILKNTPERKDNTENVNRESKRTHFEEKKEEKVKDTDSASMSSEKWRKDGNKHYTLATPDLCSAVIDERLKKAVQVINF